MRSFWKTNEEDGGMDGKSYRENREDNTADMEKIGGGSDEWKE